MSKGTSFRIKSLEERVSALESAQAKPVIPEAVAAASVSPAVGTTYWGSKYPDMDNDGHTAELCGYQFSHHRRPEADRGGAGLY